MPFEELPHTADWAVHVWAGSLSALFAEAARAVNVLSGARPAPGVRLRRTFEIKALDTEDLLVAFLSELIYYMEQENLVFSTFNISLDGSELRVSMSGALILSLTKAIKAVTYHNLRIHKMESGFEVDIVFDV
ncbi:MAG: archease [Anaerolineales bacterium]|jgi:SHS2 domain-containing protein